MTKKEIQNETPRPPIVVILGHVDHGKTTLLDFIRKSNIAESEPGLITQNIGAFQIEHDNKLFTFIDTPGHEAFSHIRSRCAKIADIAILVVASDEGIKEQTKEAYEHIKMCKIPFLVALNKIDKPEKKIAEVKKQLADIGIFLEGWGGDVPCVEISAKTGQGINEMLELIDLMAQVHNILANPAKNASGVIIASQVSAQEGISASLIVKNGTLKVGDFIITPSCYTKIISMTDSAGKKIFQAPPSFPLKTTRLKCRPLVEEEFLAVKTEQEASALFDKLKLTYQVKKQIDSTDVNDDFRINTLFLIVKANEQNSLEAVLKSIETMNNPYVKIRVIRAGLGDISPIDIEEALFLKADVLGFQVKIPSEVRLSARNQKINVAVYNVIYDLLKAIKEKIIEKMPVKIIKEVIGSLQILKIFKTDKYKILFGGKVLEGKVLRGAFYEVSSDQISQKGKIVNLQQDKIDVQEVLKGRQCGILGENFVDLKEGQIISIFTEKEEKPTI